MKISFINCFCDGKEDSGNPAAVVENFEGSDAQHQDLAVTLYASDRMPVTVFLQNDSIRFFYPTSEMNMCVHGSLAVAYIRISQINSNECSFTTRTGKKIRVIQNGNVLQARLQSEKVEKCDLPLEFLNLRNQSQIKTNLPFGIYSVGSPKFLIPLQSSDDLSCLKPDFDLIKKWSLDTGVNGLYIYAPCINSNTQFIARAFNPKSGYNEDAATGVAVGALASVLKFPNIEVSQGEFMDRPCKLSASYINDDEIWVGGIVAPSVQ